MQVLASIPWNPHNKNNLKHTVHTYVAYSYLLGLVSHFQKQSKFSDLVGKRSGSLCGYTTDYSVEALLVYRGMLVAAVRFFNC